MRLMRHVLVAAVSLVVSAGQTGAAPVQTCLAAAADFSPVFPTRAFPHGLREINCVFELDENSKADVLTSVWTAVDVGDAAPANTEMARGDLALHGQKHGKVRYSQDAPLPVGNYKLDVLTDGRKWRSVDFTVEEATEQPPIPQPADLFPLQQGWKWRYNFVQQAGKGVRLSGADSNGKFSAKVLMSVAGDEDAGTHIQISRDEQVVAEEWWKVTEAGLVSPQRKLEGEMFTFDPPQVLWALPLENGKTWSFEPGDGSYSQSYTMWGPLPVRSAPQGKLGWVVVMRHTQAPHEFTVERHFVPGFGLTREVIIQATSGELLSRQEMTLTGATAPGAEAPSTAKPARSTPKPKPAAAISSAADYFPLAQGMSWTYIASGEGGEREIIKSVTAVESVGGRECLVVNDPSLPGMMETMHFSSAPEAVEVLKAHYELKPMTWLKLPLKSGDSWTSQLTTTDGTSGGTLKFSVQGEEEVSTPAGSYKALRVKLIGETDGPTLNITMWLAPGVGEVKRVMRLDAGGQPGQQTVMVLKQFTAPAPGNAKSE